MYQCWHQGEAGGSGQEVVRVSPFGDKKDLQRPVMSLRHYKEKTFPPCQGGGRSNHGGLEIIDLSILNLLS